MLLGLVTIPYLIRNTGLETFGVLTLVWALIGYFSIFDFGIGRALTHQVSSELAKGSNSNIAGTVKTGTLLMAAFGLAGGAILAFTAHQFGYKWLNVSAEIRQATSNALMIAAIGIPMTTLITGLRGVLEGFEDFRLANVYRLILGIANFGLPALSVLILGPSLEYMVASLVLARAVLLVAHWVSVSAKLAAWPSPQPTGSIKLRELLHFGAWMTLSNIISPLLVTADRFIISNLLGAAVVAYYTVPFDLIVRLLIIPAALTSALFPRLTNLLQSQPAAARHLYRKSFLAVAGVMLPLSLVLALMSKIGLTIWVGSAFADRSWLIAAVLALGLLCNSLAQIPHAAVQAGGNIKGTAILHLTEFLVYIPFLYLAIQLYGLTGAAVAWVARVLLDLVLLMLMARRDMK